MRLASPPPCSCARSGTANPASRSSTKITRNSARPCARLKIDSIKKTLQVSGALTGPRKGAPVCSALTCLKQTSASPKRDSIARVARRRGYRQRARVSWPATQCPPCYHESVNAMHTNRLAREKSHYLLQFAIYVGGGYVENMTGTGGIRCR